MKSFLILIFLPALTWAVSEEEISRSVLENFPLIEEAELKNEAAASEIMASRGAFDHKLSVKTRNRIEDKYDNTYLESSIERRTPWGGLGLIAGHRQGRGTFPAYDGKYVTSGAGEIFAGLTLPVLRNFSTDEFRTDLENTLLKKEIAEAMVELKENIYLHKALSLYYKWIVTNKMLQIRQSMLEIALERQSMMEKRFKAGDVEKLKLTDNERTIDKRKDELSKTKVDWLDVKTQLEVFYRTKEGAPVPLDERTLPSEKLRDFFEARAEFDHLPQMKILQREIKIMKNKRELYDQSRLPGLNLEVLGSRELSGNNPYDPQALQLGVKFDLPLENRKARGKTLASEYKYLSLLKQRDYLLLSLGQQLDFSLQNQKITLERWKITNSEFQKTITLSQAERNRWNQGASDLYIVNLREQDTADADIKRWKVWFEYHQAILDARLFSGKIRPSS